MKAVIVNIDVADVETARRFYAEGLGCTYLRHLFDGHVVEMAAGGTRLYLLQHEPGSRAVQGTAITRDYETHWTPVHLDILVEDLDAALARAIRAGARTDGTVHVSEWGRLVTVRDPFGHGICLLQFLGAGYDLVEVPRP